MANIFVFNLKIRSICLTCILCIYSAYSTFLWKFNSNMVNFYIEIDGGKTVFRSNETITGNVVVECTEPMDFKCMFV